MSQKMRGVEYPSISPKEIDDHPSKDFGKTKPKSKNARGGIAFTAKIPTVVNAAKKTFDGEYSETAQRMENQGRGHYAEKAKPALVLIFKPRNNPDEYICDMGRGVLIYLVDKFHKWEARAVHKGETLFISYGNSAGQCVARLCGNQWYFHKESAEWWSLYQVYRLVHFQFPFGREKTAPKDHVTYLANKHLDGGHFLFDIQAVQKKADKKAEIKPLTINVPKYQRPTGKSDGHDFSYNMI